MHISRMKLAKSLPLLLLGVILSGCTITQNVRPMAEAVAIDVLYIEENPATHMAALLPEMVNHLRASGFNVEVVAQGGSPIDAYYMTYTANWRWDMAMYLYYFKATLVRKGQVLAEAEYDARSGGGSPNKFGATMDKIRPLLDEMLANARPDQVD